MDEVSFEHLVNSYYESLYRFALSLTRHEADACDITQQTFYRWASKGGQLRDKSKVKPWLFTTLHREFLSLRRREVRFPQVEISSPDVGQDLPSVSPSVADIMDSDTLMEALLQVDELYRAPLVLFYLEDHSYLEIAEVLDVPPGTVMSRLSRGKEALRRILSVRAAATKIVPLESLKKERSP